MSEATQQPTELDDDIDLADTGEQSSDAQGVSPVEILAPAVVEVLATAADLAGGRGHALISTDDVFAALISSDCAATRMLESLDMRRDMLLDQLAFVLGRNSGAAPVQAVSFTPRVERVLDSARLDAARRESIAVDSLHLLGAILRERSGVPSLLLETPGLGLEPVGAALNRALREGQSDPL